MIRVLVVATLALFLAAPSEAGFFRRRSPPKQQGPRYGLSQREQAKEAAKVRKAREKSYRWRQRR